jgi:hypothetical protein
MKIVWFRESEGFNGLKMLSIVFISSSDSVEITFFATFGGFRSLAMLLSTRPPVTSQLKEARKVLTWPCTVAGDRRSAFVGL